MCERTYHSGELHSRKIAVHSTNALLWLILVAMVDSLSASALADAPSTWPRVELPAAQAVKLEGPLGDSLRRGVERLAQPPYSEPWLRADVSFEVNRIFTNYSGDVSGRFLELASLTSSPGSPSPATLPRLMDTIVRHQRADGHFGVEIDLTKRLAKRSPVITLLWGNARLLVGLVTAARECHRPELLAAARRLGDFYVNTADQLCLAAREAEYHSSGTDGESYCCCYFPAIEGLVMLYSATRDERYLKQAERMADFFQKFDALPIDHSHGNLCAWRGILNLYEVTGDRRWLTRAQAKWDAAVRGGYVWPLGGVGEHWHVNFGGDEGCSESDWLRFAVDLWRSTGETRYLDVAERLLTNQYATNQCANGGFGMCHLDGDAHGPVAVTGQLEEWPFCCSFHGPLGLQFLKSYLVAGSERGIYVNFLEDFTAPVHAAGKDWTVAVSRKIDRLEHETKVTIRVKSGKGDSLDGGVSLWVRMPPWPRAGSLTHESQLDPVRPGYREFACNVKSPDVTLTFPHELTLEHRKFRTALPVGEMHDVAILEGPEVLFASPATGPGRPVLLATTDSEGRLCFPGRSAGVRVTVTLPSAGEKPADLAAALQSAPLVRVGTWSEVQSKLPKEQLVSAVSMDQLGGRRPSPRRRTPFMFDLVVVPAGSLAGGMAAFAQRIETWEAAVAGPRYGDDLERHAEYWLKPSGWAFTPKGLHITGGDVALLDAEGYGDYRLEFDLVLPREGVGVTGWVVCARDENDCLMFQLQTADSTFNDARYKPRPNSLRPHVRRQGNWELADPLPLPIEVRRGETHHVVTECRAGTVTVSLDGHRLYAKPIPAELSGTIGFRAANASEQGMFQHITLKKL